MRGGSALLRRQITLITLLVAAVSLVLIAANIAQLTRSLVASLRDQAERVTLQAATAVEAAVVAAPDEPPERAVGESQAAREFAEAVVRRGAPITSLVIVDREGRVILQAPQNQPPRATTTPLEVLAN